MPKALDPAQTDALLDAGEVAARLNLSRHTVYKRIRSGDLPCVYLGSGPNPPVRVSASELDRWLEAHTRGAR